MSTWILIIMLRVGSLGYYESNALTNVPGFKNEARCEEAGNRVVTKMSNRGSTTALGFVCIESDGVK